MTTTRAGTGYYNIHASSSDREVRGNLHTLTRTKIGGVQLSVLGIGEYGGRPDSLDDFPTWRMWKPDVVPHMQSSAIMFDEDVWAFRDCGAHWLHDATAVGSGAGPSTITAKWATWLTLENRATGQVVSFVDVHTVPDPDGNERRTALLAVELEQLLKLLRYLRRHGHVVMFGDLNVNYAKPAQRELLKPLTDFGVVSSYDALGRTARATHAGHWLDYLMLLQAIETLVTAGSITFVAHDTWKGISDHLAILGLLELTGAAA